MRRTGIRIAAVAALTCGLLAVGGSASAHRLPGIGGRASVTSYYPHATEQVLVVEGRIRVRNRNAEAVTTRCRIEVRTSEGRIGRVRKRMAVDGGGGVLVKRWRVEIPYSGAPTTVRKISVPHCHAV